MLSRFRAIWIPQGLLIKHQVSRAKLKFSYFRMWENQTINYRPNSDQKVVKILGKIHIDTYIYIFKEYIFVAAVYLPSHVGLFVTPWTVARQAPLPMGFSRQEYWSGLPFPLQGIFPTQALNLHLLHWQADFFLPRSPQGSPSIYLHVCIYRYVYVSVSCVWRGGAHKVI